MRNRVIRLLPLFVVLVTALAVGPIIEAAGNATVERMENGIPKITAENDYDALFALGYIQAQDRFFQMDMQRRMFAGRLAELFGPSVLPQDIQMRTMGLDRAAAASLPTISAESMEWLQAYSDGINAYLSNEDLPLPPEYGALELTRASIPAWTPLDSMVTVKGLTFGLSFGLEDIDFTITLLSFQAIGEAAGFDGTALFFEDLYRTAPFDSSISIPDFTPGKADAVQGKVGATYLNEKTLELLKSYTEKIKEIPLLGRALRRDVESAGSNWWLTSGDLTESGFPILANDPHLSLSQPSVFYEAQMIVENPDNPMNVFGVTFPGAPMFAHGCTPSLCWGSTVNPMDVTDVYAERLALSTTDQLPIATYFDGHWELLERIHQTFYVNSIGDGAADTLAKAPVANDQGGITFVVPRRNHGPIVDIDTSDLYNIIGISVQYTGWGATREPDAFRIWARAQTVEDFQDGVQYFDFGSQNWAVATVDGDIAYFTSAEMPLREDLQTLNAPDGGIPPFLIRDGTHQLAHEWMPVEHPQPGQALPYEILPAEEMPHEINPDRGYILNANNDPVGTSLDNNPLNQLRPGGGLYYLSRDYAKAFRMGRLQRLYDQAIASGEPITVDQIKNFQANNQLLDAEVFTPVLVGSYDAMAGAGLIPPEANPNLAAAIEYLRTWDYSTPTGIVEGYDPGDDPENLPEPDQAQIDASIAATIYAAWRGQMVLNVVDGPLNFMGFGDLNPPSSLAMTALRNIIDNFETTQGVGASGIPFIPQGNLAGTVVMVLSHTLDLLAGDDYAAAFQNSTNLEDYRWGYLHRIVFRHPLGGPFSIPTAGGLNNLAPDLPGMARSGGYGALDASAHGVRAADADDFMFSHGPARRFVGHLQPSGVTIFQTTPGGVSGVIGSPHQADALRLWLTNDYLERTMPTP